MSAATHDSAPSKAEAGSDAAAVESSASAFPSIDSLWRSADSDDLLTSALSSADAWVWSRGDRRRLLALSGAVPFNGEPSLTDLAAELTTPTELHHVRNHGPVPNIEEQNWRLEVRVEEQSKEHSKQTKATEAKGAGKSAAPEKQQQPQKQEPKTESADKSEKKTADDQDDPAPPSPPPSRLLRSWTLSELRALPSTSLLVTLSCDGIRRKELNTLGPHTKGINTGPAATGTSLWTGVLLRDVLRLSGVEVEQADQPADPASASAAPSAALPAFTVFTGLDSPAEGAYGTSLPSVQALDPRRSLLLAWAQNGAALTPDHGAPMRLIVPGCVGGRSVKWIGSITLSHSESRSHYHNGDNMRLPPEVSIAAWNGGSHYGADFRLYEQLVNSVIAHPTHEEWVQVESLSHTSVPVSGFATAGGGRRIVRVEVSTDGGASWRSAEIKHADDGEDKGKDTESAGSKSDTSAASSSARPGVPCWSWCFWHVNLPAVSLLSSPIGAGAGKDRNGPKEIVVRASDEACNSQGPDLCWNVLGMMNNAWYRVSVETRLPSGPTGPVFLRFQHPVLPGAAEGGWMKQRAAQHQTCVAPSPVSRAGPLLGLAAHRAHKLISAAEVALHASRDDCWIVLDSTVYDVTPYLKDHPGGPDALIAATQMPHAKLEELFTSIHARDAVEITGRFAIGVLAPQALIDALSAFHFDRPPAASKAKGEGASSSGVEMRRQRSFIRLEPDAGDAEVSGAKLALSSSKEGTEREEHRRSHWQEQPSPQLVHPLRSDLAWFPAQSSNRRYLLHSTRWCPIRLLSVVSLNHDTKRFTFGAAPSESGGAGDAPSFNSIGLTTGQHLLLGAMVREEFVVRPYTPTRPTGMDDEEADAVGKPDPAQQSDKGGEEGKQDAAPSPAAQPSSSPQASGPSASASPSPASVDVPRSATFDLVIKIYRRHGLMPGGKLTTFLDQLTPDTKAVLRVKGPTGHILYLGSGFFNIHGASVRVRRINLIGGGTGITPLWQLFRSLLHPDSSSASECVSVSLVYANKSEADILLRQELDELAQQNAGRARIVHVLSRAGTEKTMGSDHKDEAHDTTDAAAHSGPPPAAGVSTVSSPPSAVSLASGRVSAYLFRRHLFNPSSSTLTFVCGPPPMQDAAISALQALGFDEQDIVEF